LFELLAWCVPWARHQGDWGVAYVMSVTLVDMLAARD